MDSLEHGIPKASEMPRFDDGMVNIQELIRIMAESIVNEIMDAQAEDACADGNRRNGYRERSLTTSVGTINLRIPKLRRGSYFPEDLLVRYSRVDRAVVAAVSEMVTCGVSTRKIERVATTMGIDRMSSSQVSRICETLDASVADLRERDLSDVAFPYIWVDATYVKCRDEGRVTSCALVTAIGAGSDGYRHLLGLDAIDTESYAGWLAFLRSLRERGVAGALCVTSDAHEGLRRAIEEVFPGAAWQRCIVHLMRNAASCAHAPEKGGGDVHPARGIRGAGSRSRSRALPSSLRRDLRLLREGRGSPRGSRDGCARILGFPLCPSQAAAHQQRAGEGQPGAQAKEPRGAGLPIQKIAHPHARSRVLRDGRGLGGEKMVHGGVDCAGRRINEACRSRTCIRGHCRGTCQANHRRRDRRQPDRKEGCVDHGLEYEQDSRCLHQDLGHYLWQ